VLARARSRRWSSCRASVAAVCALAALPFVLTPSSARAQAAPPAGHEDDAFDFMNLMAHHDLHDIVDERWNAYGQFTYISQWKPAFSAAYTNVNNSNANGNSLLATAEQGFTASFTLFFGMKLWPGGELYLVPEVIAEQPFSGLKGIGGAIQDFELQKTGSVHPQLYRSRTFLRQTFGLGGDSDVKTSDPMQLGSKVDKRRIVFTLGNFTILDVFDRNSVSWDPRQTFLNMAFMTHASWDFAADARGYSDGATEELYWDDWAIRVGRMAPPSSPNQEQIDLRFWKYYGDAAELEHDHTFFGQAGAVRLLGYRNQVYAGQFADAIAAFEKSPTNNAADCSKNHYVTNYASMNSDAPDLCYARKSNVKLGVGINVEQHLTTDIGVFARAMYSDGQTEVDAFNSADRSVSIGAVAKGSAWKRPLDVTGVGFGMSWISAIHAQYLAMGGVDGFVGDGQLNHVAGEGVAEAFYSVNFLKAIWLSGDYQFLWNPAYNADRGPVNIFGVRVHAEF